MASAKRYPFWTHDTVAAAVLAGVAMASLQSKLDGVANELNIPVVTAVVHGWPMLALFAALGFLVLHSVQEPRPDASALRDHESVDDEAQALSEAVGDGLGFDEAEDESEHGASSVLCVGAVEVR